MEPQLSFTFYYCVSCGAMFMKNFRDDYCKVCRVAMKVTQVVVATDGGHCLSIRESPAPHES
jgi:hypothetical protein